MQIIFYRVSLGKPVQPLMIILTTLFILFSSESFSQHWLYPESIHHFNFLSDSGRKETTDFLPAISFWGEAGMYALQRDENHRWDVTVGGTIDLLGNNRWNLIFETNLHLIVDPNNNISFNPRGFVWTEGLLFGMKSDENYFQIGYQHRCKHDVDNLELLYTTQREESRSLIYGSGIARWERNAISIFGLRFLPLAEVHAYLLVQDQRFPRSTRTIEPTLESLSGAIRLRPALELPLSIRSRVGLVPDVRFTTFSDSPDSRFGSIKKILTDPAIEIFYELDGAKAAMRFFARYCYQSDDFIPPIPQSTKLIAFGVRIFPIGS